MAVFAAMIYWRRLKMALTDKLTLIASAIREKTGTTELLKLDEMDDLIAAIESRLPSYSGSVSVSPSHQK